MRWHHPGNHVEGRENEILDVVDSPRFKEKRAALDPEKKETTVFSTLNQDG